MIAFMGILALTLLGGAIVHRAYVDSDWLVVAGLAFPIGAGVVTLFMFFVNFIGWTWSPAILIGLTCLILIGGFVSIWRNRGNFLLQIKPCLPIKNNPIAWYSLILVVVVLIATLAASLYWPVSYWDDVGLYDLRGKVWAETGTMNTPLMRDSDLSGYFKSASPMISLLHSWFYQHGGENPHLLHFLFLISLCLYCFAIFKPDRSDTFALFATLFVLTTPEILHHGMIAYTNLSALLFFMAGIYPLTQRKVSVCDAVFLGFLLGLAGWTRYVSEPMVLASLVAIGGVTFLQHCTVRWDSLIAGIVFLIVDVLWIGYQILVLGGLSTSYANGLVSILSLLDGRIFELVSLWAQIAGSPGLFGGALVLFLLALLWDRAQSERPLLAVILAVWLAWMLTFVIVDQGNVAAFVLASGFRVWMPGAVLMIVWVARSRIGQWASQQLEQMMNQSTS